MSYGYQFPLYLQEDDAPDFPATGVVTAVASATAQETGTRPSTGQSTVAANVSDISTSDVTTAQRTTAAAAAQAIVDHTVSVTQSSTAATTVSSVSASSVSATSVATAAANSQVNVTTTRLGGGQVTVAAQVSAATTTTTSVVGYVTAATLAQSTSADVPPPIPEVDLMTVAFTIVTGVGECIRDGLANTEGGIPNRVCLVVPGSIAWDHCECGQLAQSITSVASSNQFPTPANEYPLGNRCGPPLAVVTVNVSLTRCVPGVDDFGNAPSCDALFAAARILEDDRLAVRKAINCCLFDLNDEYRIHSYTIGAANSVGPEGSCVGIDLTYQFGIPNTDCC